MRLASVLEKFSEYCNSRKNIIILCHKFFTYQQHEGQHFHDFVTELKKLRSECEFETIHDSLIKDMIVCDTHNNYLRECLSWIWIDSSQSNISWSCCLLKRLLNMPVKFLSQMRPSICTRFQNTQNLEVKPRLKLQR